MNTKELNEIINAYTHGTLSAIEFLLKVQLESHAVQNLLTASKLPAKAFSKIEVGDLMSTDDIEIESTYLEAFNSSYVAKCNADHIASIVEVEIPRAIPINVVYFKFDTESHALNFIKWLQSNGEDSDEMDSLEFYLSQKFMVVRVPVFILTQCEIPYNPPKQVIEFITEQLGK